MDMTQFMLSGGQKLFLVVVLDIFLRRLVGWHLSHRCRTREWLKALDLALLAELPTGTRARELTLRLDNGCQPTSNRFQDAFKDLWRQPGMDRLQQPQAKWTRGTGNRHPES